MHIKKLFITNGGGTGTLFAMNGAFMSDGESPGQRPDQAGISIQSARPTTGRNTPTYSACWKLSPPVATRSESSSERADLGLLRFRPV
jgi:hypothetical protein